MGYNCWTACKQVIPGLVVHFPPNVCQNQSLFELGRCVTTLNWSDKGQWRVNGLLGETVLAVKCGALG